MKIIARMQIIARKRKNLRNKETTSEKLKEQVKLKIYRIMGHVHVIGETVKLRERISELGAKS